MVQFRIKLDGRDSVMGIISMSIISIDITSMGVRSIQLESYAPFASLIDPFHIMRVELESFG